MKEVWQEITQGIGKKTILLALLSLAIFSILTAIFFSTLKETALEEKRFHIVSPLNEPIQTNFTQ